MQDFKFSSADWREQLRKNTYRTYSVLLCFVGLYTILGLLVDIFIYTQSIPIGYEIVDSHSLESMDWTWIVSQLLTFKIFPMATLCMLGVALFSIFITYTFYDKLILLGTNYHEVTFQTAEDLMEKQLCNIVEEMQIAAGLAYMPKIYIIDAPYMNAFASGYSEKSALITVTRGLLKKLNRSELQAVIAHELSHIQHQDIKITLFASILSNLMLMVLDFLFYSIIWNRNRSEERKIEGPLFLIIILLRYLLPLTTVLLMFYLSRTREYMADAGCVKLMRENLPLAQALCKIHEDHTQHQSSYQNLYTRTPHENVRQAAYVYNPAQAGIMGVQSLMNLFSTHPPLKDRLKAIGIEWNNKDSSRV